MTLAQPLSARAERSDCVLDAAGQRVCGSRSTCTTRASCIVGTGTESLRCEDVAANGDTTRECLRDCTTLFSCTTSAECPRVNGIAGTCSPVSPPTDSPMICTWTTPSLSAPADEQVSYCVGPGYHVSPTQIALCHRRTGALSAYTEDYYRGDCDGDGCPNGRDNDPCTPAMGACDPGATAIAYDSPFCAPLPALACTTSSSGLVCFDARPCMTIAGSNSLACPASSVCEAGWSDVPRCRPSCSTMFLCQMGPSTASDQCPILGGHPGTCVALPSSIPPTDGRDGVCRYDQFLDVSCAGMTLDARCFHDPRGNLTSNFFAGDCDNDGAPNDCDTMICTSGGQTSTCDPVVGTDCTPTYTPPPDAGVDGGNDSGVDAGSDTNPDAGTDAGTTDAGTTTRDAGSSSNDGATTMDAGLGTSFSGGGGCRCAAAGTRTRPWAGAMLLLLGLGLVMRARARR